MDKTIKIDNYPEIAKLLLENKTCDICMWADKNSQYCTFKKFFVDDVKQSEFPKLNTCISWRSGIN